jgi:hypothetical protein
MISGNSGLVQVSIVAISSMVDRIFGTDAMHSANTPKTKATECGGGVVEGNSGRAISGWQSCLYSINELDRRLYGIGERDAMRDASKLNFFELSIFIEK